MCLTASRGAKHNEPPQLAFILKNHGGIWRDSCADYEISPNWLAAFMKCFWGALLIIKRQAASKSHLPFRHNSKNTDTNRYYTSLTCHTHECSIRKENDRFTMIFLKKGSREQKMSGWWSWAWFLFLRKFSSFLICFSAQIPDTLYQVFWENSQKSSISVQNLFCVSSLNRKQRRCSGFFSHCYAFCSAPAGVVTIVTLLWRCLLSRISFLPKQRKANTDM